MLLLIPSFLGMAATRVNYDILSYLPESLETVEGQDIMVDEFGMGAFSMVVVEDMPMKDYPADFIDGVLIGAWEQIKTFILNNISVPFN